MKLDSFRLRLALLSAALAGSTLVGFGAISWLQIYNAKISRLDAELLNQLLRVTPNSPQRQEPPVPGSFFQSGDRQSYKDSLSYTFATNTKTPVALLVLDSNGNILYQSNSLPADLEVNRLLLARLQLTSPPPKREPPPLSPNTNPPFEPIAIF